MIPYKSIMRRDEVCPNLGYYVTSGILHASSGLAPHRLHSPRLFLIIGLFVAQVPLNSFPVNICRMLINAKDTKKREKMIINVESSVFIVLL